MASLLCVKQPGGKLQIHNNDAIEELMIDSQDHISTTVCCDFWITQINKENLSSDWMQFYQPQQPNITHLVFYFLLNSQVFGDKIKTPPPPNGRGVVLANCLI
jgi:hypothetical protein